MVNLTDTALKPAASREGRLAAFSPCPSADPQRAPIARFLLHRLQKLLPGPLTGTNLAISLQQHRLKSTCSSVRLPAHSSVKNIQAATKKPQPSPLLPTSDRVFTTHSPKGATRHPNSALPGTLHRYGHETNTNPFLTPLLTAAPKHGRNQESVPKTAWGNRRFFASDSPVVPIACPD